MHRDTNEMLGRVGTSTSPQGGMRQRRRWMAPVLVLALALTACSAEDGREVSGGASSDATPTETAEAESSSPSPSREFTGDPVAYYPLDEGFASAVEGAPDLRPVGDVELVPAPETSGRSAAAVDRGSGLTLDARDLLDPEVWTLAVRVRLDGGGARWNKLVDVRGLVSDTGFYVHEGKLQYYSYNSRAGMPPLDGSAYATVVLRRDADERISWFLDGEHQTTVDDAELRVGVVRPGTVSFLLDDGSHDSGVEEGPGRVAWISVFDRPLDDATIAEL